MRANITPSFSFRRGRNARAVCGGRLPIPLHYTMSNKKCKSLLLATSIIDR